MSLNGTVWAPVGPSPITEGGKQDNGMVTSIAINPNNSNIIYIGTAGGGVWRTRDGGKTWTPLFDRQPALGIGEPYAVAIDPNNTDIIYAGTSQRVMLGTGNTGIFGGPDPSQGLFKSFDAGNSWIQMGSGFPSWNIGNANSLIGQRINAIIVDPANGSKLFLSSSSGVYHSIDGGLNWTQGTGMNGDARSLVLDISTPVNSRILYAGVTGVGAFRSKDGGVTWTKILDAATPAVASAIGSGSISKVIIALPPPVSPVNPSGIQVLYVTIEGRGGAPDIAGLFISKDQGASWSNQTASGITGTTQGGYSFHMAVDPASPGDGKNDIIYYGTQRQMKSIDSGVSFSSLSVPHADTHAWAFIPRHALPSIVFCGNDGGIDVSHDGGATWNTINAGGLQTGLFFNMDIKPDATGSVLVGSAQDNGLMTSDAVFPNWISSGGDGFDIAYDGVLPGVVYGTSGFWGGTCTQVQISTADGAGFGSPIALSTVSDQGCGLFPIATDPGSAGIVYVSGNQHLWQSKDGGSTWKAIWAFSGTGDINVAAADGNNVVIGISNQVFVSTNALASSGITFSNITRNLPTRNVARVRFDPVDPTILYAVLGGFGSGGHIFQTTIGGSSWNNISPTTGNPAQELDIPCNAIALDGTDVPTTIYVGTDLGVLRSMDLGLSWSVLDDIHFPRVSVADLVINQKAGVLCAATYGRGIFKFGMPAGAAIAMNLQNNLDFGTVCSGPDYLTLELSNVGSANLIINNVQWLMGSTDFTVLPTPATPLIIRPGDTMDFSIQFLPTQAGVAESAIIRISSNDPTAPVVDVAVTGTMGTGTLSTAIADSGDFGNVCVGSFVDEQLTLNNPGHCPLRISNITCSADFEAPGVQSYPLIIAPGSSMDIPVRFSPAGFGAKLGTVTIFSDDPNSPKIIKVKGVAQAPVLTLMIANTGNFGNVCVGSFADENLVLSNSGKCTLSVTDITSSSSEFLVPKVASYPINIAAGCFIPVPIRLEPTGFGPKNATITIVSNDPSGPKAIDVSGYAPSGKLAITGSLCFGGVKACCGAERTLTICNVGDCKLNVTSVEFKRKNPNWKLIHNPFPATLHPGSCLNLVVRYKAKEKIPRCCELVILSNDPATPEKIVEVLAYTIWDDCCKDCCDDCKKGCCDKHSSECREGCVDDCCEEEDC